MDSTKAWIGTTWRSYVAEVFVWPITFGAILVSFWTQAQRVATHDGFTSQYHNWPAFAFAIVTDFGALGAFFLAREGAHRGTPTWGAWLASIACFTLSLEYNIAGSWGNPEMIQAHAAMPALAIFLQWWMLHGRSRKLSLKSIRGQFTDNGNTHVRVDEHASRRELNAHGDGVSVRVLSSKARQMLAEHADVLLIRSRARANLIKRVADTLGLDVSSVQREARNLTKEGMAS